MKAFIRDLSRIVLLTLSGLLGAVIVGLLMYGTAVFSTGSPGFSFVAFGFSGAIIFAFYHVRGLSDAITAAVVVSVIQFIVSLTWITMLNAGIWSFGVNIPIIGLAYLFEYRLTRLSYTKFLPVAATYGVMFVLLTLLLSIVGGTVIIPAAVFRENFFDGLLLGCGLGLGIQAGELLFLPWERPTAAHPIA